jgi:putative transposase
VIQYQVSASRERKQEKAVWQRRFWEHQIRDETDYQHHVDYIHYNPVKHDLARSPVDWEYSSFRRFVQAGLYTADWGCGESVEFPEEIGGE